MAHPIHPALVHFPIAYWSVGGFADLVSLKIGEAAWRLAVMVLLTRCVMALAAMISGLIEYGKIEQNSAAARDANRHMLWVFGAWTAYVGSLFVRLDGMKLTAPDLLSGSLSLLGFVILCVAAWYGGQLVYRHGVGVARNQEKTSVDKSRGWRMAWTAGSQGGTSTGAKDTFSFHIEELRRQSDVKVSLTFLAIAATGRLEKCVLARNSHGSERNGLSDHPTRTSGIATRGIRRARGRREAAAVRKSCASIIAFRHRSRASA